MGTKLVVNTLGCKSKECLEQWREETLEQWSSGTVIGLMQKDKATFKMETDHLIKVITVFTHTQYTPFPEEPALQNRGYILNGKADFLRWNRNM